MTNQPAADLPARIAAARKAVGPTLPGTHLREADLALMGAADSLGRGSVAAAIDDLGDAARAARAAWLAGELGDDAADRLFRQVAALWHEARGTAAAAERPISAVVG